MGWCHEFGPQIWEGCDHPMVAGPHACSCPECGVVCQGQNSGCLAVWAAGPKEIKLRRPSRESALHRAGANGSATNGAAPLSTEVAVISRTVDPPSPPADNTSDLRPVLNALRAEISVLSRKVDQLQTPASPAQAPHSFDRAITAVEALPDRLRRAVDAALKEQSRAIARDLEVFRAQEVDEIRKSLEAHAEESVRDRTALVREIDIRFTWLVGQLSDRFVTLGNAISQIERHVDCADDPRKEA